MAANPPLKSAQNVSVFEKYSTLIPKSTPWSKLNTIKSLVQKKPGTNRLKQGSAEKIRNILNK